jgi:sulfoacetaldehyde dehydrogenase
MCVPALASKIDEMITRGRTAHTEFRCWTDEAVDDAVSAVAWCIYSEETADKLSRLAVDESGIGVAEESSQRLRSRVLSVLRDMSGRRASGLVETDHERGLRVFAKSKGIIALVTPSTAPVASVVVQALSIIKTRNAGIFCPNPAAVGVIRETIRVLHEGLNDVGAPLDLLQLVVSRSSDHVTALTTNVDFVIATGGKSTVRRALSNGKPGLGGGAGNAITLIDATADVDLAAEEVVLGKSFDNGTSCSAESCILVDEAIESRLREAMLKRGAYHLTHSETKALAEVLWPSGGRLNREVVGRGAQQIAAAAQINVPADTKILVGAPMGHPAETLGREKLCPVLGLAFYRDFRRGLEFAQELIDRHGPGHSAALYSRSSRNIDLAAHSLRVSRLMLNQSTGMGNTGRNGNGMPPSVTLSCGSWGGSVTNDNITWRHMLNYTTESRRIEPRDADERSLFGRHWGGK